MRINVQISCLFSFSNNLKFIAVARRLFVFITFYVFIFYLSLPDFPTCVDSFKYFVKNLGYAYRRLGQKNISTLVK